MMNVPKAASIDAGRAIQANRSMIREKLLTNAVKQPEPELFLIVIPFPSVTKACE